MASLDPLKSVISITNIDDTSLVVPSVRECSSGQQRVLEQVQTLRRKSLRSSSSRSGSGSFSPTSPSFESVFLPSSNGSVFFGNALSKTLHSSMKQKVANSSKESTLRKNPAAASYQSERRTYGTLATMAVSQTGSSLDQHDMARLRAASKRPSVPLQRFLSSDNPPRTEVPSNTFITSSSNQSQFITTKINDKPAEKVKSSQINGTGTSQNPGDSEVTIKTNGTNWTSGAVDITMEEAVVYLSKSDEAYQHCGASYIQHRTFTDDKAKEEVLKHNGIPPLVTLLRSDSAQVSQTAAAALRNLSYRSNSCKEAIHRQGGITEAAALLRETDSVELQKQLTGLLWNLSSAEDLKPDLLKSALPVLMERVILPYTTGPDRANSSTQDPEVFYHATGCLRNLSRAKQSNRQVMRKCRGLVDSLVAYVGDCVDAGNPDDKSAENCVYILHNLTFQLEAEAASLFSRITALSKTSSRSSGSSQGDTGPIGWFSPQSKSAPQAKFDWPLVEDSQPSGASWLFHSKTLQTYLDLLSSSQRSDTQEACCGSLHNLTAHEGIVSRVMGHTIVQKLNGLDVICPLLMSNKVNLQRSALALVGNLTKNPGLQSSLARKALPELVNIIKSSTGGGNDSDDSLSMACQAASTLIQNEPAVSKGHLNRTLINSLTDLSQNNFFPKASKAASQFLCNLWSNKDLQSFLKKQRMGKPIFINDTTTSALKVASDGN